VFDEGSIVLKRISLSKFGSNRKAAHKRRLLFDKLYLMAEFNPKNEGYGCVITTIANLAHKTPILTQNEARRGIDWLHENSFIHRERSSKYCNNGYLIKINHYEKLNKIKVLGNANQLTTNCQPTDNQLTSITIEYIKENNNSEKPTANQLPTNCNGNDNTYNQRKERKERNIDIHSGNTPEVVFDSTPKKTRKKSELPEWVTNLYISKLADHFNQTIEKVGSADTKKLNELFKVVPDESRMSQLFTYYFTLQDDFCKPKGYPLALLVKNQATFFRAMSIIQPQQGKLRKATV